MAFEQKHSDLLNKYHQTFGLPALDSEAARQWTYKLGQQFALSFPAENWGTKQADGSRPQSTDCIARQTSNKLLGYDVLVSQGAPNQTINLHPEEMDISDQIFIPTPPQDWIGEGAPTIPQGAYPSYEELGGDASGIKISTVMESDYRVAGRPGLDGNCGAWMQRTVYDFVTGVCKTVEESIEKHRAEWCAELGIAVPKP